MDWLSIALIYVSGIISGLILGIAGFSMYVSYIKKKLDTELKTLKDKKDQLLKDDPIAERMLKVKEITMEQLNLQAQAEAPQKNALHGRYKNGLVGQIKELEEEKTKILQSIITDGHDPEVTVVDNHGEPEKVKLSSYLTERGMYPDMKVSENTEEPKTKQIGKFTVYRGGKDDGTH